MTRDDAGTAASDTAPAVEVNDLTCRYGDFTAVDRVGFDIAAGELFAFLGTNGAGKTTTIETLHGLRRPAGGSVRVLGRDPWRHRRALAADVAVIGQDTGFADDLTATETLRLWTDLHGRAVPGGLLERVDLAHRAGTRVGTLSGGEKRRLDLALAIATGPKILFADEPTTGLDPRSRRATWELLRELTAAGTTVLLTTHYLDEAADLADRVAIMHRGSLIRSGTVEQMAASFDALITARLPVWVAAEALPEFAGTLALEGADLRLRTADLQADLHRLLAWADTAEVRLGGLKAAPATLDDVFAELDAQEQR